MSSRPSSVIVVVLLMGLSLSSTAIGWGAKGDLEPNTPLDATGEYMFLDAEQDPSAVRKVYFNGFSGAYLGYTVGVSTGFNPNFAALDSRVENYPFRAFALLGVWKDCNLDGYIGYGDNGLLEYRAELLPANSPCPVFAARPTATSVPVHNDGIWVREYLPIGWDDVTTPRNDDYFNFNDTGARVWADNGLPTDTARDTCAVRPMPRGTLHSTGGFLRWSDCFTGYKLTAAVNDVDSDGSLGLSFSDAPYDRPDQSGSMLNQQNPYGDPRGPGMVGVSDCSAEPVTVPITDPTDPGEGSGVLDSIVLAEEDPTGLGYLDKDYGITDDTGVIRTFEFAQPSPSVSAEGSPAGTVNRLDADTGDCDYEDAGLADQGYTLAGLGEGDFDGVSASKRTKTDQVLTFSESSRPNTFGPTTGWGTPNYPGDNDITRTSWFWVGTSITAVSRNPYVNRDTLGPEAVGVMTYYAYVSTGFLSSSGLQVPATSPGIYGGDHCDGPAPITGAWECDPDAWWKGPDGGSIATSVTGIGEVSVRVGAPFNLRDVDCRDGSVGAMRDQGISWGTLSGTSCPT